MQGLRAPGGEPRTVWLTSSPPPRSAVWKSQVFPNQAFRTESTPIGLSLADREASRGASAPRPALRGQRGP